MELVQSVMTRSFAEAMGVQWAPDVAAVEGLGSGRSRIVTWEELLNRRRTTQAKRLQRIRRAEEPRIVPCYIWTFENPGWLCGGWHCYAVTRSRSFPVGGRCGDPELALSIMEALPLGHLPLLEAFRSWMKELVRQRPRQHLHDPRKAGSVVGWLKDHRRFYLDRPR